MEFPEWKKKLMYIRDDTIRYLSEINKCDQCVVVFDIDETLLDLQGNVIPWIFDIYNYIKSSNIQIVLITYRLGTEICIKYTLEQLKNKNITDFFRIYFSPNITANPYIYKQNARRSLFEKNYHVIMSIGDEPWDIGNYGGRGILLPKLKQ